MATFRSSALIIKKFDVGEADRILTVFTKDFGKLKVSAKGVRRMTSRKGGSLDLFNEAVLFFSRGRNIDTVTEATTVNSFQPLRKDLRLISYVYYLCEIVDSLCPEAQPLPFVFDLLVSAFNDLQNSGSPKVVWDFEYQLLTHLGFLKEKKREKSGLRVFIEELIERELKTPRVCRILISS